MIQAIVIALEDQDSIPAIKVQMVLIQAVASDEWWPDVTVTMLESMRKKLRALVKLIEKGKRIVVYTDFEDELGESIAVNLPDASAGLNLATFRDKARQFLQAHEDHLALQRLRRNLPLTPSDLEELEKMLIDAGGSKAMIDQAKEESQSLGIFIRSLVGLEREAALHAFGEFITGTTAAPNQIEFIEHIIQELTQNGVMAVDRLYERRLLI